METSLEKVAKRRAIFQGSRLGYMYKFVNAILNVHNRETLFGEHHIVEFHRSSHFELTEQILAHEHPLFDAAWEEYRKNLAFDAAWEKLRKTLSIDTLSGHIQAVKGKATSFIPSRL